VRVLVIGGTGHIGSYLTPRLVRRGHQTVCISRRQRQPYVADAGWAEVEHAVINRTEEEERGRFGERIAALRPDVVIDLTCYTLESAVQLSNALAGRVQQLIHCGTIWVHGPSVEVPTSEEAPRRPFGDYGCRKAAIERYLLDEAASGRLPATVLHPGHLVGRGWGPINPAGNFNPQVFDDLSQARPLRLPNFGLETLHHVHADDVAQAFERAVERPDAAIGESFHVVSPAALTCRGYAEGMAAWYGVEPQLEFVPYDDWRAGVSERDAATTLDHLRHSPNCSIAKARARLGYQPRYTSLAAVQESVTSLIAFTGRIS
jgi:nucleoside-diphosphate-sugar epimerase